VVSWSRGEGDNEDDDDDGVDDDDDAAAVDARGCARSGACMSISVYPFSHCCPCVAFRSTITTLYALKSALHLSASTPCSKLMHSGSVADGVRSVIVT
jgi:hypothetical protein